MSRNGFRELVVGQRAKDLAVLIYKLSSDGALSRDFGLRDQIRRSAVSIASNIAEGDERGTDKESVRFFYIAKGSVAELRTQLAIASEAGFLARTVHGSLETECARLGNMIGSLIRIRSTAPRPSPLAPRLHVQRPK